ncbi:MAG: hypothetical protein K2L45_12275 [Muribaculaceae bacterium]|nr:hypothetical protein [Muribaculaceae bacterium]
MDENNTENRYKPESNDFKPKTEEELAKERKSRKWELIAGAVGDMGSAFANLFFTTKGAPSTISTAGKNRQITLMDRVNRRYKEEDEAYGKKLSAWEKEREKQRKEAERLAKENERVDIHAEFNPLASHWDDKDYIGQMYESLQGELKEHLNSKGIKESKFIKELSRQYKDNSPRVLPYIQQSILNDVLSGELYGFDEDMKSEIDEDFLKNFRKTWSDNDNIWVKMK